MASTAAGTANQYLKSNGTGAPTWQDLQWTTATNDIYYNTGNVGIGTATPGDPLYVQKNQAGWTRMVASNTNAAGGTVLALGTDHGDNMSWIATNGSTNTAYGGANTMTVANAYGDISIISDSAGAFTERMRVLAASGNVGIGVAAPASKLQVNGAITNAVKSFTGAFTCGTSTIDFGTSNFINLNPSNTIGAGTCAVSLTNMVPGGSYTLVVMGTAATNAVLYNFAGYTFKYLPANATTIAGKDTIYTFVYNGTSVYVTWSGGY
jgi:hypothetical protein